MIDFLHPEAFLLALPAALLLRGALWPRPLVGAVRIALLALGLAILAGPQWSSTDAGRDLILVVDRSRSVGADGVDRARELITAAIDQAEPGDRIGAVSFGREAVVELPPSAPGTARSVAFDAPLDTDATDLAVALDRAIGLVSSGRQASVLVVGDGEITGAEPSASARAAARRGIRVDVVPIRHGGLGDVAVDGLELPGEVAVGEPFRMAAWIRSDRALEAPFRLLRGDEVIATGTARLAAGLDRIVFEDRVGRPGVHRYRLELDVPGDPIPDNDRALGVLRAAGPDRVLVVSPAGRVGRLANALGNAAIDVVVKAPEAAPLDLDRLDGFRVVVLENVPLAELPNDADEILATWVRDFGGGLLMTGGEASFGVGGYHRTPIEDVLPVTMEIRQEQRRFGLAMAIALDRSGSMQAPAGDGRTKMDLANLGTIAAIELLGPIDSLAVIAVDSSPHVIVDMQPVTDRSAIIGRVRRIESMGGGIFVGVALEEMAKQLVDVEQTTRHMILFADAADAEEPGDYQSLLATLRSAGVTLSVIGLGDPTDVDAALLLDLAREGGGRCKFVKEVAHLPRVFAQETLQVARSSFIEEAVEVAVRPDLLAVGELDLRAFPAIGGYTIAYLQPGATAGLTTVDDVAAPLFSFWQRGLGRTAAYLGEIDGEHTGAFGSWDGNTGFLATVVRWLGGSRASSEVWTHLRREGHEAVLTVELAEGREDLLESLAAVAAGPGGERPLFLERLDARRLTARFPLDETGVYRAVVRVGDDRVVKAHPVALPYSPEFEPRRGRDDGATVLARIAAVTDGRVDPPLAELMTGSRQSLGYESLAPWLAWMVLALLLAEIAVRRLEVRGPQWAWLRVPNLRRGPRARAAGPGEPAAPRPSARPAPRDQRKPPPDADRDRSRGAERSTGDAPKPTGDLASMLDRARARARRRP